MKCDKCFSTNLKIVKNNARIIVYKCQNCKCKMAILKKQGD